jgi:hypothetical protein
MDIAYGKFAPGQNVGLVNNSPVCTNKDSSWTQIGGPLSTAPIVGTGVPVQTTNLFGPTGQGIFSPFYNQQPTPPALPSQPPPPQYQPQQSGAQPGQYFGNSYTPVPATQPFPGTQTTNTNTNTNTNSNSSLGSSLLDLIRPITASFTGSTSPVTVTGGTKNNVGSLKSGTSITVTPIGTISTSTGYNQPQTFVQTYMPERTVNVQAPSFAAVLENVKNVLLRILEILRVR